MRFDYNTLTWNLQHNPSVSELLAELIDGGYDGLYVRLPRDVQIDNLEFLTGLSGLKYLEVNGSVRDDSLAFSLPGIEQLVLLTRSRVPVRTAVGGQLESLSLDDRPEGLELSGFSRLQSLTVWSYARDELDFWLRPRICSG